MPKTITLTLSDKEEKALEDLSRLQELSLERVLIQGLRLYQHHVLGSSTLVEHTLKTWPQFFSAIWDGRKRFEIRRDDREFRKGDFLYLHEFEHYADRYTGRLIVAEVLTVTSLRPLYDAVGMDIQVLDRRTFGQEARHATGSPGLLPGFSAPAQNEPARGICYAGAQWTGEWEVWGWDAEGEYWSGSAQ